MIQYAPFRAVHLYVSLGDWGKAVELLVDNKEAFRAAVLIRTLIQAKMWRASFHVSLETSFLRYRRHNVAGSQGTSSHTSCT